MSDVDRELLTLVVRNVMVAADHAVIGKAFASPSDRTRAAVEAAFEMAAANGLIRLVPVDEQPEWLAPFPPYERTERPVIVPASDWCDEEDCEECRS